MTSHQVVYEVNPEAEGGYGDAIFDPSYKYRYLLRRHWNRVPTSRWILWVMMNPSTADHTKLDPTLRRCAGFSRMWGFDGMVIANVSPFRSSDPRELKKIPDEEWDVQALFNRQWIEAYYHLTSERMIGFGACPDPRVRRDAYYIGQLARHVRWNCLGQTKDGCPRHPLFVSSDTLPREIVLGEDRWLETSSRSSRKASGLPKS